MKKPNIILCLLIFGFIISACKKDTVQSSYPYQVKMTDDPGPFSAVYIDLQGVEITGSGGAVMLNVHAGIYNLLNFSNGLDTLIASGTLHDADVQQIRLILGTNNSVVIGGLSFPLSTPSADQSGLKLQVHQTLQADILYSVVLDFDANKSIALEGNGTYKLKPVIRTIETAISGTIKGRISPAGTQAFVTVTSDLSYTTSVNSDGYFTLPGLPPGTYSITVTPALPFSPVMQSNIIVVLGLTTNIGLINL